MKDLKNLKGAKMLSKMEQKVIKGGFPCVGPDLWCPSGSYCCEPMENICRPDFFTCPY